MDESRIIYLMELLSRFEILRLSFSVAGSSSKHVVKRGGGGSNSAKAFRQIGNFYLLLFCAQQKRVG